MNGRQTRPERKRVDASVVGGMIATQPEQKQRAVKRAAFPLLATKQRTSHEVGSGRYAAIARLHSIISSAATNRLFGTLSPSALAVFKLMTNSGVKTRNFPASLEARREVLTASGNRGSPNGSLRRGEPTQRA